MKALVSGATGFVGSHLVEGLVRRGVEVTALVRSARRADILSQFDVRQVPGSLGDRPSLLAATCGQDVVFHLAGLVAARGEAEFMRANLEGTANLLQAASAHSTPPRFVHVSSMAAGGPTAPGRPLTGNETPRPVTSYGRSKLAGEEAVRGSRLQWTILRPPMVYGPRDREVLKIFRLSRIGVVPVFGDGSQELSAVYGPDLAEALIAAATSDRTIGGIYYACHPERFSSRGFVEAIGRVMNPARKGSLRIVPLPRWVAAPILSITSAVARVAGQTTILTRDKANEFFEAAWTGDPGPLMRDTGWTPIHGLATGLARTAEWYKEHQWI